MNYAEVIRTRRTALGMNQAELAEKTGVSRNTVAGWETGHSRPDPDTIPRLCDALRISINRFFGRESKREISYELLDSRRGLNSSLTANSWTYFNEAANELFLACDTGVFVINTGKYSADSQTYRMSVPSVRMDGVIHRMERGMPLTIGRGVRKLELYPEVVNYTIQDPNVGYKLEGFDREWTIIPQNSLGTITYTNLPDGNYNFRLAVFDSNQESILAERSYEIIKDMELQDRPGFIAYLLTIPMFTVGWLTWLYFKRRNQRIERELAEANRRVEMGKQTVAAIAKAVDAKDERTGGHSQRVAEYSRLIAKACGMNKDECQEVEWAAKLHDIGKIAIPDAILNKDGRLTDEEYARMKSHTLEGAFRPGIPGHTAD